MQSGGGPAHLGPPRAGAILISPGAESGRGPSRQSAGCVTSRRAWPSPAWLPELHVVPGH